MSTKAFYSGFVNLKYRPTSDDMVCLFRVQPAKGVSMKVAAGAVAGESSIGTWTELTTLTKRIKKIGGKAFSIDGNYVKVAYPSILFEEGSMPQVWSAVCGNIFGMKATTGLRLMDIHWPDVLRDSFPGPQFGIDGIRKIFKEKKRPLIASVPKPKIGMTSEEHANIGYQVWTGGLDLLKDDENLTDQKFNRFDKRARLTMKMRDKAEKETGEKKSYLLNITAETKEMLRRAKLSYDLGNEFVMVDILTAGWSGLQSVREFCKDHKMAIHAHRAFHAAFDRNPHHGLTMLALAGCTRLVGTDTLHIGTVIGKLEGGQHLIDDLQAEITKPKVTEHHDMLANNWGKIKPLLPTSSGGLHPGMTPKLIEIFGNDVLIQMGGGIHGHPDGSKAGAMALRQSIDASLKKIDLAEYAKTHKELKAAIDTWGIYKG